MPFYHQLGKIPGTKHITFKDDSGNLYWEELFSTLGFSGIYSTLYRINQPPRVEALQARPVRLIQPWDDAPKAPYHFLTHKAESGGDILSARKVFLYNNDCTLATATFDALDDGFYRNSRADEILFVHEGEGELHSEYGVLPFRKWDYLVIPRGVMYRFEKLPKENRFFIIESYGPVETPRRYRNHFGQMLEHSPFCERDMRRPQFRDPIDKKEEVKLTIKSGDQAHIYTLSHHPFDVVGWDGYLYPWAFNIQDFMPIVGKVHQPPPVHQVFEAPGFVVCNFVPRLFDFHPDAVPAPYFHQNVDSDEVLYYVDGDFMSRKGIESGSVTLHPGDIPHGPQPGKIEASIGKKDCYEYAVMVDTFKPLQVSTHVRDTMDKDYLRSWLK